MSSFLPLASLRPPNFSAGRLRLFGQDCLLCAAPSGDEVVCASCESSLPRLQACCPRCAAPLPVAVLCGACQRSVPRFDAAACAFEYRFPVDRLVHRFKYAGDLATGRWLALQLAARTRHEPRPDLLVAAPLTPARLRSRGFNQAVEIAKPIARALRVRVAIAGVVRTRDTQPQPGLRRRERRANLRGAFRCDLRLSGEHVAVIDDVMTTGATADALAAALHGAGAGHVSIWAVARTPDPASAA
jgi:ComF family protein